MKFALESLDAPRGVRIVARIFGWPFKWLGLRGDPALSPVVRALVALGPAYIKFGQLLSTRADIVGPELAAELQILLDRLPAFPEEDAKEEIRRELGASADELFSEFSEPVAAASLAQVHRARVRTTGREVAVKILRPGIERRFRRDVDAFYFVASMIELFLPASRRLHPTDVIRHFERVVRAELDLRMEASAASEVAANTEKDRDFAVPSVVWHLCARRVMTLDWANGIPLGDTPALVRAGHDPKALSVKIMQSFLRHALRDGYFHADMHQGNLMVGGDGELIAVDFGITGRIDAYTRRIYAEILYGFIRRDYRRVARVHFEAGYVPRGQDMAAFAQALRSVGEPIFGQDATNISMGRLLSHLFEVTERFGMETRTELLLLQKTMVVVEGVARSLDPKMNIWNAAQPVVNRYISENIGPKAVARDLRETLEVLSRFGPRLPQMIEESLNRDFKTKEAPQAPGYRNMLLSFGCGFALAAAAAFAIAHL